MTRTVARRIVGLVTALTLVAALAAPAAAVDGDKYVSLANAKRASVGLKPVSLSSAVDKVTVERANQMAKTDTFSHDLAYVESRLKALGVCFTTYGEIIAWDGYCYVHDDLVLDELDAARRAHPNAKIVIHPEARRDLLEQADFVVSTSRMAALAEEYDELIIGTERGLIDRLHQLYPNKTLVPLSRAAICGNMKVNTLAKLAWCLDHEQYEVRLDEHVRERAELALRRMLDLSGGWRPATAEEDTLEHAALGRSGCGCA